MRAVPRININTVSYMLSFGLSLFRSNHTYKHVSVECRSFNCEELGKNLLSDLLRQPGPEIACRLAIARNMNGYRDVRVPEILGEWTIEIGFDPVPETFTGAHGAH